MNDNEYRVYTFEPLLGGVDLLRDMEVENSRLSTGATRRAPDVTFNVWRTELETSRLPLARRCVAYAEKVGELVAAEAASGRSGMGPVSDATRSRCESLSRVMSLAVASPGGVDDELLAGGRDVLRPDGVRVPYGMEGITVDEAARFCELSASGMRDVVAEWEAAVRAADEFGDAVAIRRRVDGEMYSVLASGAAARGYVRDTVTNETDFEGFAFDATALPDEEREVLESLVTDAYEASGGEERWPPLVMARPGVPAPAAVGDLISDPDEARKMSLYLDRRARGVERNMSDETYVTYLVESYRHAQFTGDDVALDSLDEEMRGLLLTGSLMTNPRGPVNGRVEYEVFADPSQTTGDASRVYFTNFASVAMLEPDGTERSLMNGRPGPAELAPVDDVLAFPRRPSAVLARTLHDAGVPDETIRDASRAGRFDVSSPEFAVLRDVMATPVCTPPGRRLELAARDSEADAALRGYPPVATGRAVGEEPARLRTAAGMARFLDQHYDPEEGLVGATFSIRPESARDAHAALTFVRASAGRETESFETWAPRQPGLRAAALDAARERQDAFAGRAASAMGSGLDAASAGFDGPSR